MQVRDISSYRERESERRIYIVGDIHRQVGRQIERAREREREISAFARERNLTFTRENFPSIAPTHIREEVKFTHTHVRMYLQLWWYVGTYVGRSTHTYVGTYAVRRRKRNYKQTFLIQRPRHPKGPDSFSLQLAEVTSHSDEDVFVRYLFCVYLHQTIFKRVVSRFNEKWFRRFKCRPYHASF